MITVTLDIDIGTDPDAIRRAAAALRGRRYGSNESRRRAAGQDEACPLERRLLPAAAVIKRRRWPIAAVAVSCGVRCGERLAEVLE
jgi:hypothetical protein